MNTANIEIDNTESGLVTVLNQSQHNMVVVGRDDSADVVEASQLSYLPASEVHFASNFD